MDRQKLDLKKFKKSYVALITTLILGAVGVAVASTALLLGLSSSRGGFVLEQSNQAKALANACAEEALQQIWDSIGFTGTNTIALGQGTCTYTVTSLGMQNRLVTASGTVSGTLRKVRITITQINPQMEVDSWREVVDF